MRTGYIFMNSTDAEMRLKRLKFWQRRICLHQALNKKTGCNSFVFSSTHVICLSFRFDCDEDRLVAAESTIASTLFFLPMEVWKILMESSDFETAKMRLVVYLSGPQRSVGKYSGVRDVFCKLQLRSFCLNFDSCSLSYLWLFAGNVSTVI